MKPTRRQMLLAAAGATLAPAAGWAQEAGAAEVLNAVMDALMQRQLRDSPRSATGLGLDVGALAWTKSALEDRSPAAVARAAVANRKALEALNGIDRTRLSGLDLVNLDTMKFSLVVSEEASRFAYGAGSAGEPYVISQLGGAYFTTPDFLDSQHTIETKADADAYLARLAEFPRLLDQETELARHDFAAGATPPDFVLERALGQMRAFAEVEGAASTLVASLARRTAEKKIDGDYGEQAAAIFDDNVRPALRRQVELFEAARAGATHAAGVGRLPEGEAYYALSLRSYTASDWSPERVHAEGLELVRSLTAETDAAMKRQGLTRGSVGERFRVLYTDPKYRYPNTDEGKARLIADLAAKAAVIEAKLPAWFGTQPRARVEVRRVPPETELGAPSGSYVSGTIDGSRPGIFWINLRDTAETPGWTLPTFVYHETSPGHHMQGSLAQEVEGLPLIRKTMNFSGYTEGWGLYAEQLAVEMGMYENDPMGRIGMLHDALFRAVRMVVDSGLHAKNWSREEAIAYYVGALGDHEAVAVSEVERYCVWPGQASSYMIGKLAWLALRAKAKAALGRRFDIREFHDAGLLAGAMPLTVLERVIDDYIAAAKG